MRTIGLLSQTTGRSTPVLITLDTSLDKPLYAQIRDQIREYWPCSNMRP